MKHEIIIPQESLLDQAARKFVELVGDRRVFALYAPMGSGKTTFTRAVAKVLGTTDTTNSPTFAIVNSYELPTGQTMHHMDCYRFDSEEDALNLGFDDYMLGDDYCFIEWPEVIESLLPADTVPVTIEVDDDGTRHVMLEL